MLEISVIPIEAIDWRPDPYLKTRCGVCGVEWAEHHPHTLLFVARARPTRDGRWFDRVQTCAMYRPDGPPGPLDGATIVNIPGATLPGPNRMRSYPGDVNPPMHTKKPSTLRSDV